jgi:hypothetical protein
MRNAAQIAATIIAVAGLNLMGGFGRPVASQTASQTNETRLTMSTFVLIFRQAPVQLSEADQKRRADEVRAWAQKQNSEGRKLDPRMLREERHYIGPEGKRDPSEPSEGERVTALLFVEARDFAEAVSVAKTHPGLRYGVVSVEVRPWAPPSAQ